MAIPHLKPAKFHAIAAGDDDLRNARLLSRAHGIVRETVAGRRSHSFSAEASPGGNQYCQREPGRHAISAIRYSGDPGSGVISPPSTTTIDPVMKLARSLARNAITSPISFGCPILPIGCDSARIFRKRSGL